MVIIDTPIYGFQKVDSAQTAKGLEWNVHNNIVNKAFDKLDLSNHVMYISGCNC